MNRIVIVGASLAGVTAADALRMEGYDGEIIMLGDEAYQPYNRPPLSKAVLAGTSTAESVALPAVSDDITLRLGQTATGLSLTRREVAIAGGDPVPFDGLVLACGARARTLAKTGQRGEHLLRTLDDALALRKLLNSKPSVLVIGGGFLGMEIASTCRQLGLDVVLTDREPPLRQLLGDYLASVLTEAALASGLRIEVCAGGASLLGDTEVRGVQLADGRTLMADVVVSAVGDVPNSEWLIGSGLSVGGPVPIDDRCRVCPGVVAAGDVAARGGVRSPHWANAVAQARTAAAAMLHGDTAPPLVPDNYFWTAQFGQEVKICGRPPTVGAPAIVDGAVAGSGAVMQWTADGTVVAAATINRRMPVAKLRRLASVPHTVAT